MSSMTLTRILTLLVAIALLVLQDGKAQTTMQATKSVIDTVVFGDRSVVPVENLKFAYTWISKSDERYINPTVNKRLSNDLHYSEVLKNVLISRRIPRGELARIDFVWGKGQPFSPSTIRVTLRSGKVHQLRSLIATSGFLVSGRDDEVNDSAIHWMVYVEGTGLVDGQRGAFSARIFHNQGSAGAFPDPKDQVRQVVFSITP